jgi:hypothetical protein
MKKIKMGILEIAVTLLVLGILFAMVYPIWHKYNSRRQSSMYKGCLSNLRMLSRTVSMYTQDNNYRLPGLYDEKSKKDVGWVKKMLPYIKGGTDVATTFDVLYCPESKSKLEFPVCYGYNALLIQSDGMGINEKDILKPNKVGLLCDSETLNNEGGIISNSAILNSNFSELNVKPVTRHFGYHIIGYADGHSQGVDEMNDEKETANGVNCSFYRAVELGYIKKAGTKGR